MFYAASYKNCIILNVVLLSDKLTEFRFNVPLHIKIVHFGDMIFS